MFVRNNRAPPYLLLHYTGGAHPLLGREGGRRSHRVRREGRSHPRPEHRARVAPAAAATTAAGRGGPGHRPRRARSAAASASASASASGSATPSHVGTRPALGDKNTARRPAGQFESDGKNVWVSSGARNISLPPAKSTGVCVPGLSATRQSKATRAPFSQTIHRVLFQQQTPRPIQ